MNKKIGIYITVGIVVVLIIILAIVLWPKQKKETIIQEEKYTIENMMGTYHYEDTKNQKNYSMDLELFINKETGIYSARIKSSVDKEMIEKTDGLYSFDTNNIVLVRPSDIDTTNLPLGTNTVIFNIKDKNTLVLTTNYFEKYGLENQYITLKRVNS